MSIVKSTLDSLLESQEREKHFNRVQKAIRKAHRLMDNCNDVNTLIKGVCVNLTETLGYYNAWIALFDDNGHVNKVASAGFKSGFKIMKKRLFSGVFPDCMKHTIEKNKIQIIQNPISDCLDCPLSAEYSGRSGLTSKLMFNDHDYGILSISVPAEFSFDTEEHELFKDIAQDISFALGKIEADRQLHLFQSIVRTVPQPMSFITRDYIYRAVNDVYAQFHGVPPEKIIGHKVTDFIDEKIFESEIKPRLDSCFKGNRLQYEVEVQFIGKGLRWMQMAYFPYNDENGDITGVVSHGLDITEQKRAEESLRESELRFRGIYENMSVGVAEISLEFKVRCANNAYCQMLGYSEEELVGKHLKDFTHLENIEDNLRLQTQLAHGEIEHYQMEKKFKHRDGHTVYGILNANLIRDTSGNPFYFLGNVLDITGRKLEEQEKQQLQEQLNQAQKLEAIGMLAGGIAHDFNNILAPIMGYTEMLSDDIPKESPLHSSLDEIYAAAKRAKDMVRQILTFARQEKSEVKLMKMQYIVKEALKLIRSTVPATIDIKDNIRKECGLINADPTQIHQIVMNLAINAYHAMEETGGTMTISLKEVELNPELNELDLVGQNIEKGSYACLTVSDTGTGIPKDIQEKIFDPFFTTKEQGKGTGLGLSSVYGIVNSSGGAICVHSEIGKGTEFNIYLPVAESYLKKNDTLQVKRPIQGGNEKILIVDDEVVLITLQKGMLERLGYNVTSRTSSIEALEAFRANPDKFDMVITDMAMPSMSGDRLAVELIKIRPDIAILLSTGFSTIMSEEKALSMGIRGFIMKPVTIRDIDKKIREVLDKK